MTSNTQATRKFLSHIPFREPESVFKKCCDSTRSVHFHFHFHFKLLTSKIFILLVFLILTAINRSFLKLLPLKLSLWFWFISCVPFMPHFRRKMDNHSSCCHSSFPTCFRQSCCKVVADHASTRCYQSSSLKLLKTIFKTRSYKKLPFLYSLGVLQQLLDLEIVYLVSLYLFFKPDKILLYNCQFESNILHVYIWIFTDAQIHIYLT
jgi:hypothetical protein